MAWLSRTDIFLLLVAAYIAVTTLVRLMKRRRDVVVADLQRQIETLHLNNKREQSSNHKAA